MGARAVIVGVLVTAAAGAAGLIITSGGGTSCPVSTVGALGGPDPWGGCWPGTQNTGVPSGTSLTTVNTDVVLNTDGQTYQDKIVNGCVQITNDNITIKNVRVNMPSDGSCTLGFCNVVAMCGASDGGSNTGLVIQDSEVNCGTGDVVGRGAFAGAATIQRAYFHGNCTNTVGSPESPFLMEDSFVDEPQPYVPATDPHTDAFEVPNTSNVTIQHNTIYGEYTDASHFGSGTVNIGGSAYTNVLVYRNIIAGGGYAVYCPTTAGQITLTENRFSTVFTSSIGGFGPSDGCANETLSGNVYHETGLPITLS